MLSRIGPRTLFLALLCVQVIDVLVHIAAGQLKTVRTLASLCILFGGAVATSRRQAQMLVLIVGGSAYLALNLYFLYQNGVSNPETGRLHIPLFGFVAASLLLEDFLRLRLAKPH